MGSILTCTDIFSFIQRLRKHGTPQKIISLIEGESLLNYCTCVLIFQIINVCHAYKIVNRGPQVALIFSVIGAVVFVRDFRRHIIWLVFWYLRIVLLEENHLWWRFSCDHNGYLLLLHLPDRWVQRTTSQWYRNNCGLCFVHERFWKDDHHWISQ